MSLDAVRSQAARVAASVDLRDVRLFALNTELVSLPNGGESLSFRLNADLRVEHEAGDELLFAFGSYSLVIFSVTPDETRDPEREIDYDDPEVETEDVATFSFDLNGLFYVEHQPDPDEPFTEAELEAFGKTTGQFALYPYARELVANMTGRMGLPPLHLGVMRIQLENREG